MAKTKLKEKGLTVVELLIVMAVAIVVLWAGLEISRFGLAVEEMAQKRIVALNLAAEGIEAVRSIRDNNWSEIASCQFNQKYYPVAQNQRWILKEQDPGPVEGIYQRWVVFEKVFRDQEDNISQSGAEDPGSRKLKAVVEWPAKKETEQIVITTYLTNWPNQ